MRNVLADRSDQMGIASVYKEVVVVHRAEVHVQMYEDLTRTFSLITIPAIGNVLVEENKQRVYFLTVLVSLVLVMVSLNNV